jgi:hypothetical protein
MNGRRRPRTARRRGRRILLVGLTDLTMQALEGPLNDLGEVSAVPFPGSAFDRAVAEHDADLVVVDVTYLDEARVRPLILHRFETQRPVVVFISETDRGWQDDLRRGHSGPLADASPATLCALLTSAALKVVGS